MHAGLNSSGALKTIEETPLSLRVMLMNILGRHWRLTLLISIAALLILAGAIGRYFRNTDNPNISTAPVGEAVFKEVSESVFDYGTVRETRLILAGEREFAIRIYDFNSAYYTPGENQITQELSVAGRLLEHQEDFAESWVVIFAGASFEGTTRQNLDLCRCRIWNVARFMAREDLNNLGYWSIPAGELRLYDGSPDEDTPEIEAEEEEEAQRLGEAGLRSQRRMLIVTVKPLQQVTGDSTQVHVNEVVEALRAKGLLPTNYDRGTAKPVALDPTDDSNPCRAARKSVKGKIESLIERLFRKGR
jgi:hypothetical protein